MAPFIVSPSVNTAELIATTLVVCIRACLCNFALHQVLVLLETLNCDLVWVN